MLERISQYLRKKSKATLLASLRRSRQAYLTRAREYARCAEADHCAAREYERQAVELEEQINRLDPPVAKQTGAR